MGVLSQICKTFDWQYLRNYKTDRDEIWTQVSGFQLDLVGGLAWLHINSRWRFEFLTKLNNSATSWDRFTKFHRDIKNHYPNTPICQKSHRSKFKMAAAAILKIGLMAIYRSLWHIFAQNNYTGTKNHTPQANLLSKFNSRKIQDGGVRHFEILF